MFLQARKSFSFPTYSKYFLSYLLVLTGMVLGFYLIVKNHLITNYQIQSKETAQIQLDTIAAHIKDDLIFLSQVDSAIRENNVLRECRYNTDTSSYIKIYEELKQYQISSQLIHSIVYLPPNSTTPFSTEYKVTYENNEFCIKMVDSNDSIIFTPTSYLDSFIGQLIFLPGDKNILIYFPATNAKSNYIFFYILDIKDFQANLQNIMSEEIISIALIDADKNIVTGIRTDLTIPFLVDVDISEPNADYDKFRNLCISQKMGSNYTLISLLSTDFIEKQINVAFAGTYLSLLLLSFVGFLLIILAMRLTYQPLNRLTQEIIITPNPKRSHLTQLAEAFSTIDAQNHELKDKLENYRFSIQKSLLDHILAPSHTSTDASTGHTLINIDQFFDLNNTPKLLIVLISSLSNNLQPSAIHTYLQHLLPGEDTCIMIEHSPNQAIFLINYIGEEDDNECLLKESLLHLYNEYGYLSAISNSSNSPLDIPSLHENAMYASTYWPQIPIVDYNTLSPISSTYSYPHDILEQFSQSLSDNDFLTAKELMNHLFRIIDHNSIKDTHMPQFFIHCILIDMLTMLANCLNQANIRFDLFKDLYYETLYYCRSCPYVEKAENIAQNTHKLLDICEEEITEKLLSISPFKQIIDEHYCQPDFSVSFLATHLNVSESYVSHWFTRKLNTTFSDYLWSLRLEKAKELLCTTDLPINDISYAVGYYNPTSFRRKFKQETQMTPSQYREAKTVK